MRKLLILLLFVGAAYGQAESIDFPAPIYWDRNPEADMVDYGVYRSETPCTDPTPAPGNCSTFVQVATVSQGPDPIQWTEPGLIVYVRDYYYRVTARNTSGNESAFSNELNIRWLNPNAPGIPGSLRAQEQGANMWLDWDDDAHIAAWRIYKSTVEEDRGDLVGVTGVSDYRDNNPGRVGPRYYRVTGVNDQGDEGGAAGPMIYVGKP